MFSRVFNKTKHVKEVLPTSKSDGGRQLHGHIGIRADGIHALDDVLYHGFDLRVSWNGWHFYNIRLHFILQK
jgi:hypothetical protein